MSRQRDQLIFNASFLLTTYAFLLTTYAGTPHTYAATAKAHHGITTHPCPATLGDHESIVGRSPADHVPTTQSRRGGWEQLRVSCPAACPFHQGTATANQVHRVPKQVTKRAGKVPHPDHKAMAANLVPSLLSKLVAIGDGHFAVKSSPFSACWGIGSPKEVRLLGLHRCGGQGSRDETMRED